MVIFVLLLASAVAAGEIQRPYPPSPVIESLTVDWSTHKRDAQGSDNWQLTWAGDGHLYGAWGDGGGFGGTNSDGRVSLGFARVEGPWDACRGVNVWGGKDPLAPATFTGKSWGTIAIGTDLYMWVSPGSSLKGLHSEARLYRSTDKGLAWQAADWSFTRADNLTIPTFCQFGKGYSGARDRYVYSYFIHPRDDGNGTIQKPGTVYLARVPSDRMAIRDAYEFFSGASGTRPLWTKVINEKKPIFEDGNGVGWVLSVSYNAGLRRYMLMTDHVQADRGNLGIFDAPDPWGPWTTAVYWTESEGTNFGRGRPDPDNLFFWNMPTKWQSKNGRDVTIVFTGAGRGKGFDSFNLVRGRFQVRAKGRSR